MVEKLFIWWKPAYSVNCLWWKPVYSVNLSMVETFYKGKFHNFVDRRQHFKSF